MNSRADFVVGILLSLLGAWLYVYAERYTGRGTNSYGPNFFPQLLAVLLILASVGLILKTWLEKPAGWLASVDTAGFINAALALAVGVSYVFGMNYLGFPLSTFLFLFTTMMLLGQTGWQKRAAVSLGVTCVVYGIFHLFLKIPMPHGIFEVVI